MSLMLLLLTGLPATGSATVLLGNSTLAPSLDMNIAGQAEAFQVTAASSGTVGVLMVYVDASSSAANLVAGLYSNVSGHPGALLVQGNLANPAPGDVLVAFATSDGPLGTGQTLTVSGAGLVWSLVKRVNAQSGSTEIWTATAATTLANVTVNSTQSKAGYDQSLTVVAFRNAKGIGASATASAPSGAPAVNLTATAAGSVIYGAGNDYDNAIHRTPGTGQAIVHEWLNTVFGDTYWVQAQNAPTASAGSVVKINDTAPTSDRWNLAAVEIVPH